MDRLRVGMSCVRFDPSFWAFKESQYEERVKQLQALQDKMGFTFHSAAHSFENHEEAIEAAKEMNNSSDFVILDVAAFPEGKAFGAFVDHIEKPLAIWSRPEAEHLTNIGHNSFCGANFILGNMALTGRKARWLFGNVSDQDFQGRLNTAVKLLGAAKNAGGMNIGLIGEGIVPKFFDIDISEADRQAIEKRFNIRFVAVPTQEVVDMAKAYRDEEIADKANKFAANFTSVEVPREAVEKLARFMTAMQEIVKRENLASVAVRCWPELQKIYGMWPCSILSLLNEEGIPAACEGDPGGALDMLLASRMADSASTLMDIIDWNDKNNHFSIWHCGPTAPSWAAERKTRLMPHNVDGSTPEGKPNYGQAAIVDMTFYGGPVTIFRTLGAIDDEFAIEGNIVDDPDSKICGSFGSVADATMYGSKIDNLYLRGQIFSRALPHHYTAIRGHLFR